MQATLGKMAVGIKVTDDDGQRISFGRGVGRYFATCCQQPDHVHRLLHGGIHRPQAGPARHDRAAPWWSTNGPITAHPERQRHELGTVTMVIVVIAGMLVIAYFALIAVIIAGLVALGVAAGSS